MSSIFGSSSRGYLRWIMLSGQTKSQKTRMIHFGSFAFTEKSTLSIVPPAHKNRQSRHFDTMMLAITPRWVLQEFMKKETLASRLKNQIRKRLQKYDAVSIHPDLNSYGADDNFEWKQYFLRDDATTISKCPFHRLLKTSRNK